MTSELRKHRALQILVEGTRDPLYPGPRTKRHSPLSWPVFSSPFACLVVGLMLMIWTWSHASQDITRELFAIASGALLGVLFAAHAVPAVLLWSRATLIRATLILWAGVAATLINGEDRENWRYFVVDLGQVAVTSWIVSTLARRMVLRIRLRSIQRYRS